MRSHCILDGLCDGHGNGTCALLAASFLVLLVSLLLVQFAAEDSPQPMKVRPQRGLFVAVSNAWLVGRWYASQEAFFSDKKLTISDRCDRQ